ncbi:MAG: helix-turn-helix transcriptional regulator [Clostridia bacterium]|nr:helix-turn-helix transcriptional regulator [Clostridia bacterium]
MNSLNFQALLREDFFIEHLTANRTKDKPVRVFKCTKNMRKWERFMYVTKGKITINTDKGTVSCSAGEIMYLPYDVVYTSEWESESEIGYITLEFVITERSGERFALSDSVQTIIKDKNGTYLNLFEKVYATIAKGELGYRIKACSLLYDIFHLMILDDIKKDLKNTHRDIYKAILHIENNYIEDISVEKLAEMCAMSQSKFRKCFHEYSGTSPIKYKNALRAKKAAELLETGEYTVSEAAYTVGFDDLAYFNRVFKKAYGRNPKNFKG